MSSSWIEDPGISEFQGFNISTLTMDQAWLNVTNFVTESSLWLYELSTDCHKCPYALKSLVNTTEPFKFIVSTTFPMKYRLRTREDAFVRALNDSYKFCDMEANFGEFGVYNMYIDGNLKNPNCRLETALQPVNIYYPLLLAFLFYLFFGLLVFIVSKSHLHLKTACRSSGSSKTSSSSVESPTSPTDRDVTEITHIQTLQNNVPGSTGVRRYSTASNANVINANPYGTLNGNGNYASVPNIGNGSYSPNATATTEVSISTISSTPTSSSVTTYGGKPQPEYPNDEGDVSSRTAFNHLTTNSNNHPSTSTNPHVTTTTAAKSPARQRLRSLDTFRGICIMIMIFVNDQGGGYYFFEHATWDGLYVADLVFPWFLWIMGVCIPVSIKSQVKRNNSRFTILQKIFIRSLKLIGIGLIMGSLWGPVDIHSMRLPGVLQRFGICYFVCSTLVLFCMTINITKPEASKLRAALQDIQIIWIAWIFVLLLILIHCVLTFFLEVPGCPTGYLGPGGLHDYYYEPYRTIAGHCIGGAAGYIDQQVLQPRHIYQWPTTVGRYKSGAYDPEGILGMLTSIFQVWLGVQTGVTMLVYPRASSRLKRWGIWALVTGGLGALLCGCKQTGGWIPINKNLWSLSFVLVTNAFALILLSGLYFIMDIKRWWSGSPFFEPGMNSILLYVGHSVANSMLPWHYKYGPMRTHFSRLIESLWGTSLWALIAIYLYHKKRFWKI